VISSTNTKQNKTGEITDYGGYEIKLIRDPEEIINEINRQIDVSDKLSVCTICNGGLQFSYNNFFIDLKRKALGDNYNRIRFVSELDKNNIDIAKKFIDGGIQLRHAKIRKLPPLSFSVTDKQITTTIDMMENGTNFQSLIISVTLII
jgi:two-component system, OmpR family, sensor histidine kinase VicK